MATILSIKANVDEKIRTRSAPGSILRGDHSNIEDSLANEIRDRGCLQLASTDDLETASHDNTKLILIKSVGFFVALETADPADEVDTFESADDGWLWEKVLSSGGGESIEAVLVPNESFRATLVVPAGRYAESLIITPPETMTMKIGNVLSGDQFLYETEIQANEDYVLSTLSFVCRTAKTIYFSGITDDTPVIVYTKRLNTI